MNLYVAPLEGITGYIFRRAFHTYFGSEADKYYTPFLAPGGKRGLSEKEQYELAPENNCGYHLVPQVMTVSVQEFKNTRDRLRELGYEEINLNLGCPSKTVTTKGRGAGALADLPRLEDFLDGIFRDGDKDISIKTRIGLDYTEEFEPLMKLYNQYPIKELTIHPRLLKEQYQGTPHRDIFLQALGTAKMPVCYNGDINTVEDYLTLRRLVEDNAGREISGVMLGRGILRDPALIRKIKAVEEGGLTIAAAEKKYAVQPPEISAMLQQLQTDYAQAFSGQIPVLFKLKEIWSYLGQGIYRNSPKMLKKIMKSKSLAEYTEYMQQILSV